MKKTIITLFLTCLALLGMGQHPNLLVHYKFDSTYLSEADIAVQGSSTGEPLHAVYLDGTPKTLPSVPGDYKNEMTISFWAKPSSDTVMSASGSYTLFSLRSVCTHDDAVEVVVVPSTNQLKVNLRNDDNTNTASISTSFSITYTPGVWKKYTLSYSKAHSGITAKGYGFVNGAWANNNPNSYNINNSAIPSNGASTFGTIPLRVSSSICQGNGYVGSIRDLYIYDEALTQTQIFNAYQTNDDAQYNPTYTAYTTPDYSAFIDRSNTSIRENALNLTGQDETLGSPDISTAAGDGYTFSFWVKPVPSFSGNRVILSRRHVCSQSNQFEIFCNGTTEEISIVFRKASGSSSFIRIPYTPDQWQQIVFTVDVNSQMLSAYKDGVLESFKAVSVATSIPLSFPSSLDLAKSICGSTPYEGGLDEIKIYSKPLTASQIQDDYTTSNTITNLVDRASNKVLNIYPNPATTSITTEIGEIQIMDTQGNVQINTISTGKIDVSTLSKGIYIVVQGDRRAKLVIK